MRKDISEKKRDSIFRFIALCTAITFTSTNLTYAAPVQSASAPEVRIPLLAERIEIPESFGTVKERFAPQSSAATVIHIEDAHTSYEAQTHIEKILEHLQKKYEVNLVQVEGAVDEMDGDLLRRFEESWANRELADLLAKDGILNGADLFLLEDAERAHQNKSPKTAAYGVEELETYKKNIRAFYKVYAYEDKIQAFLTQIKERIATQSSRVFNQKLRSFAREWLFYQDVSSELMRHLKTLQTYADSELQMDFLKADQQVEWPMLTRFYKLEDLTPKVDSKAAAEEYQKLLKWIDNHHSSFAVIASEAKQSQLLNTEIASSQKTLLAMTQAVHLLKSYQPGKDFPKNDFSGTRSLLEHFYDAASAKGFAYQNYPELAKEWGILILREEINAVDLFHEVETLTRKILTALAKTEEEKKLVVLFEDYQLVKKALLLQLTPEDEAAVQGRGRELIPSRIAERAGLQTRISDNQKIRLRNQASEDQKNLISDSLKSPSGSSDTLMLGLMDRVFQRALGFYALAKKRDQIIFEKTLARMKSENKIVSALVTGGFHSRGITEQLKKQNIAYISITPRISQIEEDENYTKLMMLAGSEQEGGGWKVEGRRKSKQSLSPRPSTFDPPPMIDSSEAGLPHVITSPEIYSGFSRFRDAVSAKLQGYERGIETKGAHLRSKAHRPSNKELSGGNVSHDIYQFPKGSERSRKQLAWQRPQSSNPPFRLFPQQKTTQRTRPPQILPQATPAIVEKLLERLRRQLSQQGELQSRAERIGRAISSGLLLGNPYGYFSSTIIYDIINRWSSPLYRAETRQIDAAAAGRAPQELSWFQFSLKTIFLVVLASSGFLGIFRYHLEQERKKEFDDALKKLVPDPRIYAIYSSITPGTMPPAVKGARSELRGIETILIVGIPVAAGAAGLAAMAVWELWKRREDKFYHWVSDRIVNHGSVDEQGRDVIDSQTIRRLLAGIQSYVEYRPWSSRIGPDIQIAAWPASSALHTLRAILNEVTNHPSAGRLQAFDAIGDFPVAHMDKDRSDDFYDEVENTLRAFLSHLSRYSNRSLADEAGRLLNVFNSRRSETRLPVMVISTAVVAAAAVGIVAVFMMPVWAAVAIALVVGGLFYYAYIYKEILKLQDPPLSGPFLGDFSEGSGFGGRLDRDTPEAPPPAGETGSAGDAQDEKGPRAEARMLVLSRYPGESILVENIDLKVTEINRNWVTLNVSGSTEISNGAHRLRHDDTLHLSKDGNVWVKLLQIVPPRSGSGRLKTRLGFGAPKSVNILRKELLDRPTDTESPGTHPLSPRRRSEAQVQIDQLFEIENLIPQIALMTNMTKSELYPEGVVRAQWGKSVVGFLRDGDNVKVWVASQSIRKQIIYTQPSDTAKIWQAVEQALSRSETRAPAPTLVSSFDENTRFMEVVNYHLAADLKHITVNGKVIQTQGNPIGAIVNEIIEVNHEINKKWIFYIAVWASDASALRINILNGPEALGLDDGTPVAFSEHQPLPPQPFQTGEENPLPRPAQFFLYTHNSGDTDWGAIKDSIMEKARVTGFDLRDFKGARKEPFFRVLLDEPSSSPVTVKPGTRIILEFTKPPLVNDGLARSETREKKKTQKGPASSRFTGNLAERRQIPNELRSYVLFFETNADSISKRLKHTAGARGLTPPNFNFLKGLNNNEGQRKSAIQALGYLLEDDSGEIILIHNEPTTNFFLDLQMILLLKDPENRYFKFETHIARVRPSPDRRAEARLPADTVTGGVGEMEQRVASGTVSGQKFKSESGRFTFEGSLNTDNLFVQSDGSIQPFFKRIDSFFQSIDAFVKAPDFGQKFVTKAVNFVFQTAKAYFNLIIQIVKARFKFTIEIVKTRFNSIVNPADLRMQGIKAAFNSLQARGDKLLKKLLKIGRHNGGSVASVPSPVNTRILDFFQSPRSGAASPIRAESREAATLPHGAGRKAQGVMHLHAPSPLPPAEGTRPEARRPGDMAGSENDAQDQARGYLVLRRKEGEKIVIGYGDKGAPYDPKMVITLRVIKDRNTVRLKLQADQKHIDIYRGELSQNVNEAADFEKAAVQDPHKETSGLTLSRKINETVRIGPEVTVRLINVNFSEGTAAIGVQAPSHIRVDRLEVYEKKMTAARLEARDGKEGKWEEARGKSGVQGEDLLQSLRLEVTKIAGISFEAATETAVNVAEGVLSIVFSKDLVSRVFGFMKMRDEAQKANARNAFKTALGAYADKVYSPAQGRKSIHLILPISNQMEARNLAALAFVLETTKDTIDLVLPETKAGEAEKLEGDIHYWMKSLGQSDSISQIAVKGSGTETPAVANTVERLGSQNTTVYATVAGENLLNKIRQTNRLLLMLEPADLLNETVAAAKIAAEYLREAAETDPYGDVVGFRIHLDKWLQKRGIEASAFRLKIQEAINAALIATHA